MQDPAWADELALWLRLEQTPGVGVETARKLLQAFGLPQQIFSASLDALQAVVPLRIAQALLAPIPDTTKLLIERTREWAAQPGNHVLTLADHNYPRALLDIPDPPPVLYAKGRLELLAAHSVAVVGSRNATAQGTANAERFSEALSRAGVTIISGMALGIDTAAHEGGLRGSGSTVAVVGTGLNTIYPLRNRALAQRIAEEGCTLSEYALGTPPVAANFPRRNRIISGLAQGVLVVEAAAQSGSLITARMAGEQGRDVFAIPGSIHSPLSKGCHLLIKQGAKLVESAQDILEELRLPQMGNLVPAMASNAACQQTSPLLAALGYDPVDADTLAARCGMDIAAVGAELLSLELQGEIETLPGGMVRRLATS